MSRDRKSYDQLIPYRLWVIAEIVQDRLQDFYQQEYDLPRSHWRIVSTLSFHEDISASMLATWTNLDQTRVSQCLAQLEKSKLVSRDVDKSDRRKIVVNLSKSGRRLVDRILKQAYEIERTLLSGMSNAEVKNLEHTIQQLEHNLGWDNENLRMRIPVPE